MATTDLVMVSRLLITLSAGLLLAAPAESRITVTEVGGVYTVTAAFAVTESPDTVMAVLTDYDRIPTYLPDVQVSKVIERTATGAIVEQQAVSRFMMFSKRVHLELDIREDAGILRFRDRCGKSFTSYQGSWVISQHDSFTVVDYELSAKPSFEVPAFVLKHLLKRDSGELIDRIKAEISLRADRRK